MTKLYDFGVIASWVCDPTRGAGELDAVIKAMRTDVLERQLPNARSYLELRVDNTKGRAA